MRWSHSLLTGSLLTGVLLCSLFGAAFAQQDTTDSWADEAWEENWDEEPHTPLHGFVELAGAQRSGTDPAIEKNSMLSEIRLRLEGDWQWQQTALSLKMDVWRDEVLEENDYKIREAALSFSLGENTDIKIGRQVLTWGTGDLIFINDRFPKDFSVFAGRDDEYFKAPSDALRISHYGTWLNIDFAVMPTFAPDEYFTGERFSFFLSSEGVIGAPKPAISAHEPSGLDDTEYAIRLFKTTGSTEWAVYGYYGFYKQPSALTADGELTFAPLSSVGASVRQPLLGGIGYLESAWYHSRDEQNGSGPVLPNDQIRLLLGYERELLTNLTGNVQYYLEKTLDYDALIANSPWPQFEPEEYRHLLSARLTWRTRQDRLIWSLFTFYAPTDKDYYLRPQISYRADDNWLLTAGASLFGGPDDHSFFGQLENNSSLFFRLRYNF